MKHPHGRSLRIRYTATGALAALAAVGAIAGPGVLAKTPSARTSSANTSSAKKPGAHPAVAQPGSGKTPPSPAPTKSRGDGPSASPQPFLDDVQRLVDNGTITAAEGQAVDQEIQRGRIDTDSLTASGFTSAQLAALQQALTSTKQGIAAAAHSARG